MFFSPRILSSIVLLLLIGCTNPDVSRVATYTPPAGMTPASAATVVVGHVDTGFLLWGGTSIQITLVDEKRPSGDTPSSIADPAPLLVPPGPHALVVRAFRDPVAAYACLYVTLEAGHRYVVDTTAPDMDKTSIWVEDKATGAALGQKAQASTFREPLMAGAIVRAITAHPSIGCPVSPHVDADLDPNQNFEQK